MRDFNVASLAKEWNQPMGELLDNPYWDERLPIFTHEWNTADSYRQARVRADRERERIAAQHEQNRARWRAEHGVGDVPPLEATEPRAI